MDIAVSDLIGLAAGTLTTLSFVPQVLRTWRSRSAGDISLAMFSLFSLGVVLWLIYGIMNDAPPIILANAVTLVLAVAVLVMKLRFG